MPFHVYIFKKEKPKRSLYMFDLSRHELIENIIDKYHKGKDFIIEGIPVVPSSILEINIIETNCISSNVQKNAQHRYNSSKNSKVAVLPPIPLEYYIYVELEKNGKNVTNKFIKHPPRKFDIGNYSVKLSSLRKIAATVIGLVIVYLIVYFIIIPGANIPGVVVIEHYDSPNYKFFPNELHFHHDSELGKNISNFYLYLEQDGEGRVNLFINILEESDVKNKNYKDKLFKKSSNIYLNGKEGETKRFDFYLEENPDLENIYIQIDYGFVYEELPWDHVSKNIAWVNYEKTTNNHYEWVNSSFSNYSQQPTN